MWDGNESQNEGATLACHVGDKVLPDCFEVNLYDESSLGDVDSIQGVVRTAIATFSPACVSVAPRAYAERQVFDDKPGVGWMLYLPKVLTVQQVPEARADSSARGRQKTNRHHHRERHRCRVLGGQPRTR